jgi:tRNA pseudouridine55 synthase
MATGVLVVCVGQATRLSEYLVDSDKTYRATVLLGVETDTYDADGEVTATHPVDVDRAAVEAALDAFRGEIQQAPPMYSAVKHKGTPLYRLARAGKEVEREPRWVNINALALLDWTPPAFTIETTCSAGTYIRTLAYDLGQALGTGAHLTALRRLRSGRFHAADAVPLDALREDFASDAWREHLQPADLALLGKPAIHLDDEAVRLVGNGRDISAPLEASGLARAYAPDGRFMAILQADLGAGVWHPIKVFNA